MGIHARATVARLSFRRRTSRRAALVAVALLLTACSADETGPADATGPADGPSSTATGESADGAVPGSTTPDDGAVAGPRTVGPVGVRAATAPEWQANATVAVAAGADGALRFAQVLSVDAAFALSSLELETQGATGVDEPTALVGTVTVRPLPTGAIPGVLDAGRLPVTGEARGEVRIDPWAGWSGPSMFVTLRLDDTVDVPSGRVLVSVELVPAGVASVDVLRLVGRRGAAGGSDACADHNPGGTFLDVASVGEDGVITMTVPAGQRAVETDSDCSSGATAAAFNITLRLEGALLSDDAVATLVADIPALPEMSGLALDAAQGDAVGPVIAAPAPSAPAAPSGAPTIGASCSPVGAQATGPRGIAVRCTDVWGQRAWRPVPDAVAQQAHDALIGWFTSLPPGGAEVPIDRHPAVPAAYEERLATVLDIARRAQTATSQRWEALIYPHDAEGVDLAIARVMANLRPEDRAGYANWEQGMRSSRCGSYNQVGRNPDTGLGYILVTVLVTPRSDCLTESPDQVAAQLVREYLMGVGRPQGEPCWAGEGAGWPMGRAVMEIAGGPAWEEDWGFWVGQVLGGRNADPARLGLRRSTEWVLAPERDQYCFSGVGHIQGSLAHELLIVEHGLDQWLRSWRASTGVRGASGRSFDEIIAAADARFTSIGGRIG